MKKGLLILVLLMLTNSAFAIREDVTMIPILKKSLDIIDIVENDNEMEIVRIEFDIVTDSKETYRTLTSDYEYTIVAFGDDRIKDIDVSLYRWNGEDWVLVKKDNDSKDIAVVSYKPRETATYKVVVSAFQYYRGYKAGHYGLIFFHE